MGGIEVNKWVCGSIYLLFFTNNGSISTATASWSIIWKPKEKKEINHLSGTLLFLSVSTFAE